MKLKALFQCFCWLVLLIASVACRFISSGQSIPLTATSAPTSMPVANTITPSPTIGILPTPTLTLSIAKIPTSVAATEFHLDNLRLAYILNGNLYIQDGSNSPKQLSNSGEDLYPMFSDDGEKLVYYRGKLDDNNKIFSINADGSNERALITIKWLSTLGTGTQAGHLAFVPHTHQMLFNAYQCPETLDLGCTVGLFIVNTDTGKIKEIISPTLGGHLAWYGVPSWFGNFSVSPDGKLLSVAHRGQISILSTDGKVIRRNIMKYTPSTPVELYPRVFWLPDSSGLIAAIPAEIGYRGVWYSGDPAYTIWRYRFKDELTIQIPLNPEPSWIHMDCNDLMSVSPDGNWVIYFTNNQQLYTGNLENGSTKLSMPYRYYLPRQWSKDSIHFVDGQSPESAILGSVNTPPGSIPGFTLGWIDEKRYIYFSDSSFPIKENAQILVGEITGETLLTYQSNIPVPPIEDPYSTSFTFIQLGSK